MSSQDLADSIQEMHVKKRCVPALWSFHDNAQLTRACMSIMRSYNEIFFMVDTCQAGSLSNALESPKVVTIGSSKTGENSYAHHSDAEVCALQFRLRADVAVVLTSDCCSDAVGACCHRSLYLRDTGLPATYEGRQFHPQWNTP